MSLLRYITFLGLFYALLWVAPNGAAETHETSQAQFPIHHIIPRKAAALPKGFEQARLGYMKNKAKLNRGWVVRYWKVNDIVEFEDGWLVSADKGEWGNILYWLSREGDLEILLRNSLNSKGLAYRDDTIFVTGRPYIPMVDGYSYLFRVRKVEQNFNIDTFKIHGWAKGFEIRNEDIMVKSMIQHPYGTEDLYQHIDNILTTNPVVDFPPPKI